MADDIPDGNGLTGFDLIGHTVLYILLAFLTVAFYNVLELSVFIYTTFKKRNGLYFWSMVVATGGIALNSIGYLLKYARPLDNPGLRAAYTVLVLLGWCSMVTGQSVVLFSRLHLLVDDRYTIRLVLSMIVVDAIICHPAIFALFALVNSSNPTPYVAAYSVYEKFQLVVFFVQETVISIIYIKESAKFLRGRKTIAQPRGSNGGDSRSTRMDGNKTVMRWLIAINVLVVVLDVSVLALEFSDFYDLQTSWKCAVYSVKLKLEFNVLNRLIMVVKSRNPDLFSDGIKLHVVQQANILSGASELTKSEPTDPKIEDKEEDVEAITPVKPSPDSPWNFTKRDTIYRTKTQNSTRLPITLSGLSTSSKGSRELLRIKSECDTSHHA